MYIFCEIKNILLYLIYLKAGFIFVKFWFALFP